MKLRDIPPTDLATFFEVNFEDGTLIWKERTAAQMPHERNRNTWNGRYAGKPAINHLAKNGYRFGCLLGHGVSAHRVIFAMAHGYYPAEIDHIDGNRANNKLSNLRAVTRIQNAQNKKLPASNTSGYCGVRTRGNKWVAQIKFDTKYIFLGAFSSIDEARAARQAAERCLGFHRNHGRKESV